MIFGVKTVLRLFKRKLLETNLKIMLCSKHELNMLMIFRTLNRLKCHLIFCKYNCYFAHYYDSRLINLEVINEADWTS